MARDISTVGVIGLGTMGAGIVEVFARGGRTVIGVETTQELADRGKAILTASTARAVARGKLDETGQREILDRVSITTDLADLATADLVVEAVPETMETKHEVFTRLDAVVPEDAVLASNTSSLSITRIAAGTRHPRRVVGLHFFNPAPVLRLVEVVSTLNTDPEVVEAVAGLAREVGKTPVVVGDRAGFVVNYLLFGYLNSALRMLEHGHVSREDLDTAMHVGAGLPMGPLTLMDLIGLDVCDHIGDVIYEHSRSPQHAPSAMLRQMVVSGRLGRKSGRGFYTYAKPGSGEVVPDDATPAQHPSPAVTKVAVLGDGALAQELDSRLTEGGYAVTRLADVSDLSPLGGVELVIEAQAEAEDPDDDALTGRDVDELFSELGQVTSPGTILATANTYSAVALSAMSGRPEETVVMRLHAPTGSGQAVEIGRTGQTDPRVLQALRGVVTAIGAEPVVCRDRTGLVVDALLVPHLNDAVRMLDQGYAGVADIDTAIRHGLGYPMGPFAMIDHIGSDEVLSVCEDMLTGSDGFQPHLAPSPLLVEHALLDRPFTEG
jgi:3-hydroxybutyryl-CoA dehydrogenase